MSWKVVFPNPVLPIPPKQTKGNIEDNYENLVRDVRGLIADTKSKKFTSVKEIHDRIHKLNKMIKKLDKLYKNLDKVKKTIESQVVPSLCGVDDQALSNALSTVSSIESKMREVHDYKVELLHLIESLEESSKMIRGGKV